MPPQRRVLAHRNRRALTAGAAGASSPAARRTTSTAAWRYALGHDTRTTDRYSLPRATVPRRERRHAGRLPLAHRLRAVTELRRHETNIASGEPGRWRGRFAGLQLITAGPTDRTRDRRARPRTRRHVADSRAPHRVHGEALQHRHTQPEAVEGGGPPVPGPVVPSTPDGESAPTLHLPNVPLAYRLENQRPQEPRASSMMSIYIRCFFGVSFQCRHGVNSGCRLTPRAGGSFGPPAHPY